MGRWVGGGAAGPEGGYAQRGKGGGVDVSVGREAGGVASFPSPGSAFSASTDRGRGRQRQRQRQGSGDSVGALGTGSGVGVGLYTQRAGTSQVRMPRKDIFSFFF